MPKSKYQKIIEDYCAKESVAIPTGFYRHSAGNFAIIKSTESGKQLVAATWVKTSDVINYVANYCDEEYQIFDFKKGYELTWNGAKSLKEKAIVSTGI